MHITFLKSNKVQPKAYLDPTGLESNYGLVECNHMCQRGQNVYWCVYTSEKFYKDTSNIAYLQGKEISWSQEREGNLPLSLDPFATLQF